MIHDESRPLLSVRHLTKQFGKGCAACSHSEQLPEGSNHCPHCGTVWAVNDISFDLYEGEILGIVGESGSGKSSLVQCLYFDNTVTDGSAAIATYQDGAANIFRESSQQKRYIRNHLMGMVYQNPWIGLRMHFSSGGNIAEKLIAAGTFNVHEIRTRAKELLNHVEIPVTRMDEAPLHFSGGMQQRVQISKALANHPPILLLDEVTTGLDLSVQARVLDLIRRIQRESRTAMIVVSHDLGVIRMLCDRTMVMKEGRCIEAGLTDQILEDPHHAYTQLLVHSLL
ncbi:ATP-binding cassette domain-containing protein [Sporolactobacillus sp. STCC-11]|uniref:ATP-binding cassette domain-containing protein n=1 Tax=Sporolactobacillus caesalpiniae TaxID=3230362 RepID=UPI00339A2165